jgi:hypothetical protein
MFVPFRCPMAGCCRFLPVEMCSGTLRRRFQPSQKRCRNSAGAAQIKARLVTSMNGAMRDC